jgi:hypothetical protein
MGSVADPTNAICSSFIEPGATLENESLAIEWLPSVDPTSASKLPSKLLLMSSPRSVVAAKGSSLSEKLEEMPSAAVSKS